MHLKGYLEQRNKLSDSQYDERYIKQLLEGFKVSCFAQGVFY